MKHLILSILILLFFSSAALAELNEGVLSSVVAITFQKYEKIFEANELIFKGKWNEDKTALVIYIPNDLSSLLYVFLKQDKNIFLPVDISYLVNSDFNYKLGRKRNYYDKYEQTPVVSQRQDEYSVGVGIITRAWKNGQRYTVESKPTLIKKNGDILQP